MSANPIIIFDTSALNRLAKDSDSQPLVAGLKAGYRVRLTAMSVDELLATRDVAYRKKFFQYCRQISPEGVICFMPAGMIIQQMVASYSRDPVAFDWKRVNIRLKAYEDAIARDEKFITDENFSADQRKFARETSDTFEEWFANLRPKLQKIYEDANQKPHALADVFRMAQEDGGVFWGFAKELYRRAQEWNASPAKASLPTEESNRTIPTPDDETIKQFVDACPPFRALVLALILTWYDRSLRETHAEPKYQAGRVDQFMSVYLPFSPQFVTADGPQDRCLREVVTAGKFSTQVRLYDEFYNSFMVLVG